MDKQALDQLDLFRSRPRGKSKLFNSAHGRRLSYWRMESNKTRVQLSDGVLIDITKQSPGQGGHARLYTKIPGQDGIVQARNLRTILAQIALIDQIRAINKSIQVKLKQQDDAARALSDLTKESVSDLKSENARLRDELASLKSRTPRSADVAQGGYQSKVFLIRFDLLEALKILRVRGPVAINLAIVVQQLCHLMAKGFGKVLDDGRRYIFGTYEELQSQYFPLWTPRTLERNLVAAEKLKLLDSKQPEGRFSRRKYYALTVEAANLASSGKKAASTCQGGALQDDAKVAASSHAKNENPNRKHGHDADAPGGHSKNKTAPERTPEEEDLINQIEELTGAEGHTQHFAKLWDRLVREDLISVWKAIQETKMKKRQGEIRKSIGGTLYSNYKLFRADRERRKCAENDSALCSA